MNIIQKKENLDERSYRSLPQLSYTAIKEFSNSKKNFYRKYILGEAIESIDDKEHIILGNLVDIGLTGNEEDFDNKFVIDDCPKPTGQLAEVGEVLWTLTKKYINSSGELSISFTELFTEAFNKVKYNYKGETVKFKKTSPEEALIEFSGSDVETLYEFRRNNIGKTVCSFAEVEKAGRIKDEVLNTPWTKEVYYPSNKDIEVIHQLTIQFTYRDLDLKAMLDTCHINHKEQYFQPFDGKCTAFVESFEQDYHFSRKYFIQGCLYRIALTFWAIENGFENYDIRPMKFVVMSSTLQEKPLIYNTTEANYINGLYGFSTMSGIKMKGLDVLIDEINWSKKTGNWLISQEAFENNGIMTLKSF